MVEADHDLRNPADMLVLDKVAKARLPHPPASARCRPITRPLGTPLDHTSIPFQISQERRPDQNLNTRRTAPHDLLKQADEIDNTIGICSSNTPCSSSSPTSPTTRPEVPRDLVDHRRGLRDNIANFDDFFRPLRSYFYWETALLRHSGRAWRCGRSSTRSTASTNSPRIRRPDHKPGSAGRDPAAVGGADPAPDRQPGRSTRSRC